MATTSIRLPDDLTSFLDRMAQERKTTRSSLVREAIQQFIERTREAGPSDRLSLLRSLVDYEGSGQGDLAARSEHYLREIFDAQRRNRSG